MGGMGVMHEVKGDSQRLEERVTEGAVVQLREILLQPLNLAENCQNAGIVLGGFWGGEPQAGVVVGGVIAAMIAVTTVRRDNKSN